MHDLKGRGIIAEMIHRGMLKPAQFQEIPGKDGDPGLVFYTHRESEVLEEILLAPRYEIK